MQQTNFKSQTNTLGRLFFIMQEIQTLIDGLEFLESRFQTKANHLFECKYSLSNPQSFNEYVALIVKLKVIKEALIEIQLEHPSLLYKHLPKFDE